MKRITYISWCDAGDSLTSSRLFEFMNWWRSLYKTESITLQGSFSQIEVKGVLHHIASRVPRLILKNYVELRYVVSHDSSMSEQLHPTLTS